MRTFRSSRWLVLVLFAALLPVSSFAGVFVSVGFAPPILPVYVQPPCLDPGLMWMPGYWAYGPDGYYWVPGAWVPAPYYGALWTPPYWGWDNGLYIFHPGYWGLHVGYYGGVNYGFGYMGIGFVGGMWRGHDFVYNTAVMHVDPGRIHNTYQDRAIVDRSTVARGRRVAFSGGPGGIQHAPTAAERVAEHDQHTQPTKFQQQHVQAAQADKSSYARNNGGRPKEVVAAKPLQAESHAAPAAMNQRAPVNNNGARGNAAVQQRQAPQQVHTQPQTRPMPEHRTSPQPRPMEQERQAPPMHAAPQPRPAPQVHAAPQSRPMPQPRPAPQPHNEGRPEEHGHGR